MSHLRAKQLFQAHTLGVRTSSSCPLWPICIAAAALICQSIQSILSHVAPSALIRAHVQEALAKLLTDMKCMSAPAMAAQLGAALARLECQQLPQADHAAPRTLEALRLEDPASMSKCWNPGCAAVYFTMACLGGTSRDGTVHALCFLRRHDDRMTS